MKISETKNKELANEIKERLKANDGYCPCRVKKDESTKCVCAEFRAQIKRGEEGPCTCGLYVAENWDFDKV